MSNVVAQVYSSARTSDLQNKPLFQITKLSKHIVFYFITVAIFVIIELIIVLNWCAPFQHFIELPSYRGGWLEDTEMMIMTG